MDATKELVFKTKPYAHQLEVFKRFKDKEYFALFMDMGTGKTKVAIDIASHKYIKNEINAVLIIAPNLVHLQWLNEQFIEHCAAPYIDFVWESGKIGSRYYQASLENFASSRMHKMKVLAVNVEAFQSGTILKYVASFLKNNKVFTIIDESTRIKTPTAKRSKAIHRISKYGCRAILTGTPATKSPFDLWSQFEFLKPNYFGCNYFVFQHKYGVMMKGVNEHTGKSYNTLIDEKTFSIAKYKLNKLREERALSGRSTELDNSDYEVLAAIVGISEANIRFIDAQDKFAKFKRMDELKEIIKDDVFSIKKEDCLDLPAKVYEKLYVEMSKEQKRVYKNLKNQLKAEYGDKELTVFNKIALTTRLMQICGGFFPYKDDDEKPKIIQIDEKKNAKIVRLKEDLEEVAPDTKIIIWATYVAELKELYETFKKDYRCALYYGATPQHERGKIKKDFLAGKYDIFIGNPSTAGLGLNLQNATLHYFFSNSFKTEDRLQAEDRSHRIGMSKTIPCVYKDIILKGTIDEKVHEVIKMGKDINDFFKVRSLAQILDDEE